MNVFAQSAEELKFTDIAENVKILSRAAVTENGIEADFAGGGIAFSLNCEGDVSLGLEWTGQVGLLSVVINDDFENASSIKVTAEGEQSVIIAENLEKGEYTFEVSKANAQYSNQVVFKSLSFSGSLLEKPAQRNLKLEFYGDSISCGVGSLSESIADSGNPVGYEDSYLYSYNSYCARYLGAELSTCALPGYGYLCGYDIGRGQNVYPYMDRALFNKEVAFDHSQYMADIVVIELGTNDMNYVRQHKEIVEDSEIDKMVQDYIDKIRSYNENCFIILLGTVSSGTLTVNNKANNHYIKTDNALLRAAATNEKTFYIPKLGMGISGRGYHPKASEAAVGGKTLADFITENILSGKELPPVVAPEDFYLNFDINDDDKFNLVDVLLIRSYLSKSSTRYTESDIDVTGDGKADMKDSLKAIKKLAELE